MFSRHKNGDLEWRIIDGRKHNLTIQWIRTKSDRKMMRVLGDLAIRRLDELVVSGGQFFVGPLRVVWTKWTM